MKTNLLILLVLTLFASCSNMGDDMSTDTTTIEFSATGYSFERGNQVAVEAYNEDGTLFASTEYTYSTSNSTFTSGNPIVKNYSDEKMSYIAIYPYNATEETFAEDFTFNIYADQSVDNQYQLSDMLIAKVAETKSSKPKLTFSRAMANIVINIEGVSIDDCALIIYAKNSVTCNVTNETYTASGSTVEITPAVDGSSFKAVIAPQEVGGKVVSITVGGEEYTWQTDSSTFESGESYAYTWDDSTKSFTDTSASTDPDADEPQIQMFTKYVPENHTFTHPNALFNESDFERVRQNIATADPNNLSYCAYNYFLANSLYVKLTWSITPQTYFCRQSDSTYGYSSNSQIGAKDAAHALQCAMMWRFLSESDPITAATYGDRAVYTLNSWAQTCQHMAGTVSDRFLGYGFQGYQFALAGATLRGYEGWEDSDVEYYCAWLKEKWYPQNYLFLEGTWRTSCDFHYWTNWPLGNMASAMAIGICCEDVDIINYALKQFYEGHHNGGLEYMFQVESFPDPSFKSMTYLAQGQESGRDQGHTMIDMVLLAEFCQMAYNQNVDLFSYDNYRVLQGFEYTAKYNTRREDYPDKWMSSDDMADAPDSDWMLGSEIMPFVPYIYCPNGTYYPTGWFDYFTSIPEKCGCSSCNGLYPDINVCDPDGRGGLRASWDLIYNHYIHVAKLDEAYLYYSSYAARQTRYSSAGVLVGDPGSGDSARLGTNSSAFDQTGWSTMMFSRE